MALRREGFWDQHYECELKNFEQDGDEGEVWFGKGLNRRIVEKIIEKIQSNNGVNLVRIIDVGCGNAILLCTLVDKLQSANKLDKHSPCLQALGIDYSFNSVELSKRVVEARKFDNQIAIKQCDFLYSEQVKLVTSSSKYDFIIDKGTYDAICLLASDNVNKLADIKLKYCESICSIASEGALFILATCNHTAEEVYELLELTTKFGFASFVVDNIETPKLQFGGKEGSQVCCMVIELKHNHLPCS